MIRSRSASSTRAITAAPWPQAQRILAEEAALVRRRKARAGGTPHLHESRVRAVVSLRVVGTPEQTIGAEYRRELVDEVAGVARRLGLFQQMTRRFEAEVWQRRQLEQVSRLDIGRAVAQVGET